MHEVRQKVMNRQRNGVLTNKVVKNIIYWMKKYYMYIYKDTALARYCSEITSNKCAGRAISGFNTRLKSPHIKV